MILVPVFAFISVTGLVVAGWMIWKSLGGTRMDSRLDLISGQPSGDLGPSSLLRATTRSEPGGAGSLVERIPWWDALLQMYDQADVRMRPARFLLISAGLTVGGSILAYLLHMPMALIPMMALGLGLLPLGWVWFRRWKRLKTFAAQMPDALELLARALRAGHSLAAGMEVVSDEMPAPICDEFRRVYDEQNLGIPLEDALRHLIDRVPSMDVKFFVTAVVIQRQTGGDLAEILDKIGYVIRERFKIYGAVKALTAEGRLSGVILLALPVALFLVVYRLNPTYVSMLWTEALGRKMLTVAGILQVVGAVVIRKIVNIKV